MVLEGDVLLSGIVYAQARLDVSSGIAFADLVVGVYSVCRTHGMYSTLVSHYKSRQTKKRRES